MAQHRAEFARGAARWSDLPDDGRPEVVLLGRSNVGKSSLLNALLGRRELAYTSKTPGRTQQFNYFLIDDAFYLVDLPGYGFAKVSKAERAAWAKRITRFLLERETLRAVVHLIDGRHPPMAIDREAARLVAAARRPTIVALTKADRAKQAELAVSERAVRALLAEVGNAGAVIVRTSAAKGLGRAALWAAIEAVLEAGGGPN